MEDTIFLTYIMEIFTTYFLYVLHKKWIEVLYTFRFNVKTKKTSLMYQLDDIYDLLRD